MRTRAIIFFMGVTSLCGVYTISDARKAELFPGLKIFFSGSGNAYACTLCKAAGRKAGIGAEQGSDGGVQAKREALQVVAGCHNHGALDGAGDTGVSVAFLADNEEVGSTTKQGANSTFLTDVLDRIAEELGISRSRFCRMLAASFLVSADNAHAVHPNHPEFSDPTNKVYMNRGIVIKYNASQKYTTDSVSDAIFSRICDKAGVTTQRYTNRADMPGGSTLGNIANTHVSVNTVDIGLAQLAMHSSYETAGVADIESMILAMTTFFASSLHRHSDGEYELV
jgi:aspartyl aminopeptidase